MQLLAACVYVFWACALGAADAPPLTLWSAGAHAVSRPHTFREAVRDGVEHIVITAHLNMTDIDWDAYDDHADLGTVVIGPGGRGVPTTRSLRVRTYTHTW